MDNSLTTFSPTLPDLPPQVGQDVSVTGVTSVDPVPEHPACPDLSRRKKAAVIVQFLLKEGDSLPLEALPDSIQAALTTEIGGMRVVKRATLNAVIAEFVQELDEIGLTFPGGIEGALGMLDGHISNATADRVRREAGVADRGDPWERIAKLPAERLIGVLEDESTEVGAVMLSKLPVSQSADLLGMLPGDTARELSYAISRTGKVLPDTVRRIGLSLVANLDAQPIRAFEADPEARVSEILNVSRATTRDTVLAGLDATDAVFAAGVRRSIFTFSHFPDRITPRDIPRILRGVEQPVLVQALAFAGQNPELVVARDFVLDNMSKRLAETIREEIAELGPIKDRDGEGAMNAIVAEVRRMSEAGDLLLITEDE